MVLIIFIFFVQKLDKEHEGRLKQLEMEVNKEDDEELLRIKIDAKCYTRVGFRNELQKVG